MVGRESESQRVKESVNDHCSRVREISMPRRDGASGMTLIEVLLAVFILGIVVTGLLQALSQCSSSFAISRRMQDLQGVFDLAEIAHPILWDDDPVEDLTVADDASIADGFTFRRECEEDEDEDGLYLVTSTVTRDGGGWGSTLVVCRYIYYAETRKK